MLAQFSAELESLDADVQVWAGERNGVGMGRGAERKTGRCAGAKAIRMPHAGPESPGDTRRSSVAQGQERCPTRSIRPAGCACPQ